MKKLFALTLCAMAVVGCDDANNQSHVTSQANDNTPQNSAEQSPNVDNKIKALTPEGQLEKPFAKTESGRVIFNNVIDLFEDEALYSPDDKNIIIHSESPLRLTLKESVFDTLSEHDVRKTLEDKFIYDVFEIFAHTNVDKVDVTLEAIKQNDKPYGKNAVIKGNITRDRAVQVLQTYSSMKSFDDYVEFNPEKEFTILGFSRSERAEKFNSDKYRKQILTALLTGKIEPPYEVVKLPFDVDLTNIQVKLKQAFDLSVFQNDTRKLANGDQEYSTTISDFVRVYAIGKDKDNIVQVGVQFVFANDPNISMQSTGAIAAAMLATPNPEKSFNTVTSMMDSVGKTMKKSKNKESIEEVKLVDGLTLKLTAHPTLSGVAFLTIEKLEKQPKIFE